jgi:hypothetical protein
MITCATKKEAQALRRQMCAALGLAVADFPVAPMYVVRAGQAARTRWAIGAPTAQVSGHVLSGQES